MNYFLNYVVFLCLMFLLHESLKKEFNIFSPSNFFLLIWILNYSLLMFFVRDFYLYYQGSVFILLMCTLVFIFSNLGLDWKQKKLTINHEALVKSLKTMAYLSSFLGFLVVPLMLGNIGVNPYHFFRLDYMRLVAKYVSHLRYTYQLEFPYYTRLFLGIHYYSALINGIYFSYRVLKKNYHQVYVQLFPIFTSILIALLTTEKAVILFTLLLFGMSFFVSIHCLKNKPFTLSFKIVGLMVGGFVVLIGLFMFIQMNRYGYKDLMGLEVVMKKFKVYGFGHVSAFSIWFTDYLAHPTHEYGYGRFTLAGLYNYFGIFERKQGIFADFSFISPQLLETNVYTAFRGLIIDFSLIGSFILVSLMSFYAGVAYRNVNQSLFNYTYLIIFYCFSVFSMFTSILNYNTILFAFFFMFVTLTLMLKKQNQDVLHHV